MAPPNDPVNALSKSFGSKTSDTQYFDLSNGKFSIKGVPLLSRVPSNVTFTPFSYICKSSDAPQFFTRLVSASSDRSGFLGFTQEEPSEKLINSLGKFTHRNFLSIFRFKTWWSTMWVGDSGSDLQMETQWVLLDVPETKSYVIIIPIIQGGFRSAFHPGSDGHVMICAESGSTSVKTSSLDAIAYVHASDNPYTLMKEAFTALRVHLNTFRLLEEKTIPNLVDKFGWCTWDAFYLTVEPTGVWQGVKEFSEGGFSPRFIIIDDGWQSINFDGEHPMEDAKNLVLGGSQMTARLHRLDEGKKFRDYKGGSLLASGAVSFDPKKPKMLISKAIEIEHAEKDRDKAIKAGANNVSDLDAKIQKLKEELDEIFGGGDGSSGSSSRGGQTRESSCCRAHNYGLKAFTRDLRTKFKGLDDIYVWHALCGAWGGVRPGSTRLNSKLIPCKLSPGLDGTMEDLAVVKIVEGGIGLVHPDQADDLYDSMHSYLSDAGITGVKVDVIHVSHCHMHVTKLLYFLLLFLIINCVCAYSNMIG